MQPIVGTGFSDDYNAFGLVMSGEVFRITHNSYLITHNFFHLPFMIATLLGRCNKRKKKNMVLIIT